MVCSILGSFFFPALWQTIFFKGEGQRIGNYLLVYVGSGLFASVLAILAESMNSEGFVWLFAFSPFNFMVISENGGHDYREVILAANVAVDALIAVILVIVALRQRGKALSQHLLASPEQTPETP